jgi:hypothetical protein
MVLASDNLTYLPTPQLTTREQPFHTKHLPASYISRPYNNLQFEENDHVDESKGPDDQSRALVLGSVPQTSSVNYHRRSPVPNANEEQSSLLTEISPDCFV